MELYIITSNVVGLVTSLFLIFGTYNLLINNNSHLKKVLGVVLIGFGLMMSKDIFYMFPSVYNNNYLYKSLVLLDHMAIALGCIYVLEVLIPSYVNLKNIFIHISGFLFFSLLYIFTKSEIFYMLNYVFVICYAIVNLAFIIYFAIKYIKMMKDMYSNQTPINLKWLFFSTFLLLLLFSYWIFVALVESTLSDLSYYVMMTIAWGIIYLRTNKLPIISKKEYEDYKKDKSAILVSSASEYYSFSNKLDNMLRDSYFSDNPQLSLSELATELCTNRTTLSHYINNVLHTNFYDMVNQARLFNSVRLLKDETKNLTIEEIATLSGFNSVSTFRRAFSKVYHYTPSEFKKNS